MVDLGLRHLIGDDWRDAFDIIVVEAKKPGFFQKKKRPFKKIVKTNYGNNSKTNHRVSWNRVMEFQAGEVYYEGCSQDLMEISGWSGQEVTKLFL